MYKLVTAVLLDKENTSLKEVDVSTISLNDLFNKYKDGYLVLTNETLQGELFLTLSNMKQNYLGMSEYNIPISNWLTSIKNKTLPTINVEPTYTVGKATYIDYHQGGYNIEAMHPYSTIKDYPLSSKTDLHLFKESVSAKELYENVIPAINGYLHTTAQTTKGVKIQNGTRNILLSKKQNVGLLNFKNCGGIKTISIDHNNVHKKDTDLPFYNEAILELKEDLSNKTILFSIFGNLITSSKLFRIIDHKEGVVNLNLSSINLIDRLTKTIGDVDFPELVSQEIDKCKMIDTNYLITDAFILSLIRHPQTFAIVLNSPNVLINKTPIFYQGVRSRYFSPIYDNGIAVDSYGRIVPYFYYGHDDNVMLSKKHIFKVPLEFSDKISNVRNTTDWDIQNRTLECPKALNTRPMNLNWLNITTVNKK